MALKGSGFAGLKTGIKSDSVDITDERLCGIDRALAKLIPELSSQITCLTYRIICPPLTRLEHLSSLASLVPKLCEDSSPLQSCIQIAGSIETLCPLPNQGRVVRESTSELLSDRLHRRSKQIRIRLRNSYLTDAACFINETIELHYRLKPQLAKSTLVVSVQAPNIFDTKLWIDETGLFAYMTLQLIPERASIDYLYATQTLGCPGLLVPMDLVGLLLLSLFQQHMPERQIESFDYHVYGQLYTRQPMRLCATAIDQRNVLMWAESEGCLLYRGVISLH